MNALAAPARFVVRRRGLLLVAWLLLALTLAPRAGALPELLQGSARLEGSESERVEQLMRGPLASAYAQSAVLVVRGIPSPATSEGAAALRSLAEALRGAPEVAGVLSWLDLPDPSLLGEGGGTVLLVGLAADSAGADRLIAPLRDLTAGILSELRARHPAVTLRWSGQTALNVDLRATSTRDVERAERRALPVTGLLLLFAFGALMAASLPVAAGALAIAVALGAAAIAARAWPLSILLQSIVTMLGLGLGIDYALLMVSRFRDALAGRGDAVSAAEEAAHHAGHTILISAGTVALGFAALLTVPVNELRTVAAGGLLVVLVSALVATTLLPGVLSILGPRIDLGRVTRAGARQASLVLWRRWGAGVTARPWLALVAGTLPLLLLAVPAVRLQTGIPRGDWLPPDMESARALEDLKAMRLAALVQSIRVVVELPEGTGLSARPTWDAVGAFAAQLQADARVARVRSVHAAATARGWDHAAFTALPPSVAPRLTRGVVSEDGRLVLLEVVPVESLSADQASALVRELRRTGPRQLDVPGARVMVGGLPAFNADYHDRVAGRFPWLVAVVVGTTFLALLIAFRSVLIPLKAVVLNLLSVAAAFGAVKLVFQDGHGGALLGVAEPAGAVFSSLPVIAFAVVFGLSMDYEIFLIARVRELRRAGASDREAIVEALGRTGKVITNAAAVMLVVFAAFTLGDVLITRMLGFTLAVAVLLDATVVRMVVGPALLQLAGKWNWWPATRPTGVRAAASGPGATCDLESPAPAAELTLVQSDR